MSHTHIAKNADEVIMFYEEIKNDKEEVRRRI